MLIWNVFSFTDIAICYQRGGSVNHNNLDQKPTHAPPPHPHGHGKWVDPHFDQTMPKNITSLVGKSAYLGCRVKNLGNKTVSFTILFHSTFYTINKHIHINTLILYILPLMFVDVYPPESNKSMFWSHK